MPDNNKNFGVITEQGYPIGKFGFSSITEDEKKKLEEDMDEKKIKEEKE